MTLPGDNQALLALLGDGKGVLPGLRPTGPAGRPGLGSSGDPSSLAFQTQLRMAQALFTDPTPASPANQGCGLDSSIVGDGLLMDALSTITRLMDQTPMDLSTVTGRVAKPAAESVPELGEAGEAALLGGLSAMFESGEKGVDAIGYDRVGGTSYGKYQIASRPGSMDRFLRFLKKVNPEWAKTLSQAGPANTGSTRGAMPKAWRAIAAQDPEGFEQAQHDFIEQEYYGPARNMVLDRLGLDMDQAPQALREVLWSTAVQHGPTGAANIFAKAGEEVPGLEDADVARTEDAGLFRDLIAKVYEKREHRFGGSTHRVQESVKNRLSQEMELALNMLDQSRLNLLA